MPTAAEKERERKRRKATPRPDDREIIAEPNVPANAGTRAGAGVRNFFSNVGDAVNRAVTRTGEGQLATARANVQAGQSVSQFAGGAVAGFQDPRLAESLPERAPRPPDTPQNEAGQQDTTDGTPGSGPVSDPQHVPLPVGPDDPFDPSAPVALSQIGADATAIPRPPADEGGLPEGTIEIIKGTQRFFQGPNAGDVAFRAIPGASFEESRAAAVARDPGSKFLRDQEIAQQNADANAQRADASIINAQAAGAFFGHNEAGELRKMVPRADGQGFDEVTGVDPFIDSIVNGTDPISVINTTLPDGTPQTQIFNERTQELQNVTAQDAQVFAMKQYNKLIQQGEDPEDALEEVETQFNVTLDIVQ